MVSKDIKKGISPNTILGVQIIIQKEHMGKGLSYLGIMKKSLSLNCLENSWKYL